MKYVIFGPGYPAADRFFDDVKELNNVIYVENPLQKVNPLLKRIIEIHILKLKWIPFSKVWANIFRSDFFDENEKAIFLYCDPILKIASRGVYVEKMKKRYKNSFHIAYYLDYNAAKRDLDDCMRKTFDDIFIFDKKYSEYLNIKYYPMIVSKNKNVNYYNISSDIVFIGQAKNRYNRIVEIYEMLTQNNIVCDFYLIGVPAEEQKYKGKIKYGNFISYDEATQKLVNSKCVLELVGDCEDAYTNRVYEAIIYGKKILTDNIGLKKLKYFNDSTLQVFNNVKEIDINFFDKHIDKYKYNDDFSPRKFLDFLGDCYKFI